MKERISLTLDPVVSRLAKAVAQRKNTSVSSWVESLLREQLAEELGDRPDAASFSSRWTGSMKIARRSDRRHRQLVDKYIQRGPS